MRISVGILGRIPTEVLREYYDALSAGVTSAYVTPTDSRLIATTTVANVLPGVEGQPA